MDGEIGILALQGAFVKHQRMLENMGVAARQVRIPRDLHSCTALIIPGGESTTMTHQMEHMGLLKPLQEFVSAHPLFGTCAGMVLMAKGGPLSLLDIEIERNGFGPQAHSFSTEIKLSFSEDPFHALFIRAPRIVKTGAAVDVIAQLGNEPIFVRQGQHMACTFHPELTDDRTIHKYFMEQVASRSTLLPL